MSLIKTTAHRYHDFCAGHRVYGHESKCAQSVVITAFNPTAENMAEHLLSVIGPKVLLDTGARLTKVQLQETAKFGTTVEF